MQRDEPTLRRGLEFGSRRADTIAGRERSAVATHETRQAAASQHLERRRAQLKVANNALVHTSCIRKRAAATG